MGRGNPAGSGSHIPTAPGALGAAGPAGLAFLWGFCVFFFLNLQVSCLLLLQRFYPGQGAEDPARVCACTRSCLSGAGSHTSRFHFLPAPLCSPAGQEPAAKRRCRGAGPVLHPLSIPGDIGSAQENPRGSPTARWHHPWSAGRAASTVSPEPACPHCPLLPPWGPPEPGAHPSEDTRAGIWGVPGGCERRARASCLALHGCGASPRGAGSDKHLFLRIGPFSSIFFFFFLFGLFSFRSCPATAPCRSLGSCRSPRARLGFWQPEHTSNWDPA